MDESIQEISIKQETKCSNVKLFFMYCLGGGMAFIVNYVLLFILKEFGGLHYLIANAIGFICAAMVNYSFNKKFTFKNKSRNISTQFSIFVIIALGGLLLDSLILGFLVEKVHLIVYIAKFISAGIVLFYNFTGNRLVTFKILR